MLAFRTGSVHSKIIQICHYPNSKALTYQNHRQTPGKSQVKICKITKRFSLTLTKAADPSQTATCNKFSKSLAARVTSVQQFGNYPIPTARNLLRSQCSCAPCTFFTLRRKTPPSTCHPVYLKSLSSLQGFSPLLRQLIWSHPVWMNRAEATSRSREVPCKKYRQLLTS